MHQSLEVPIEFAHFNSADLLKMAAYHRRMAFMCIKRARRAREIDAVQRRTDARMDHWRKIPGTVLKFLEMGYNSTDSAIDATARDLNVTRDCAAGWWAMYMKRKSREERERRDQTIMHLHYTGCTNKEIARRLGVHRNTVSRAIMRS